MKADLTLPENRAAFMAQYWNQDVAIIRGINGGFTNILDHNSISKTDYLSLRPISSLTPEEKIEIAHIEGMGVSGVTMQDIEPFYRGLSFNSGVHGVRYMYGKDIVEVLVNEYRIYKEIVHRDKYSCLNSDTGLFNGKHIEDFLVSKGFLRPWRGNSCEEIIQSGIAVYRKEGE